MKPERSLSHAVALLPLALYGLVRFVWWEPGALQLVIAAVVTSLVGFGLGAALGHKVAPALGATTVFAGEALATVRAHSGFTDFSWWNETRFDRLFVHIRATRWSHLSVEELNAGVELLATNSIWVSTLLLLGGVGLTLGLVHRWAALAFGLIHLGAAVLWLAVSLEPAWLALEAAIIIGGSAILGGWRARYSPLYIAMAVLLSFAPLDPPPVYSDDALSRSLHLLHISGKRERSIEVSSLGLLDPLGLLKEPPNAARLRVFDDAARRLLKGGERLRVMRREVLIKDGKVSVDDRVVRRLSLGQGIELSSPCAEGDSLLIAAAGDFAVHRPLQKQIFRDPEQRWRTLWSEVDPWIQAADVAYINFEGAAQCCLDYDGVEQPDPGARYDNVVYSSGEKTGLNFPPRVLDGLAASGFDVISTANNHALDRKGPGVLRTLDNAQAAGLKTFGTRRGPAEPWEAITEANGFRLAWIACTGWSNGGRSNKNVLACRHKPGIMRLIEKLSKDPKIDAVIFTPHGGDGRTLDGDRRMNALSEAAIEAGALIVFAGHPHHIMSARTFVAANGKRGLISMSRGNFLTSAKEQESRTSALTFVRLARDAKRRVTISEVRHLPLFVAMGRKKSNIRTVPAQDHAEALAKLGARLTHVGLLRDPAELNQCQPREPDPYRGRPGDGCRADDNCSPGLSCDRRFWGGICTRSCAADPAVCAAPSACGIVTLPGSGPESLCLRSCKNNHICDHGLECGKDAPRVCVPRAEW